MASNVKLHFPVIPEPLAADVALERGLAGVEPDVNLEPVAVRVLARAVSADERRFKLKWIVEMRC